MAALEAGDVPPWRRPWAGGGLPRNASTGNRYNGVNVLLLQHAALDGGFGAGHWGTYNQWRTLGGQVRRGQRGTRVIFYKPLTRTSVDPRTGEDREDSFAVLRHYSVFNADQVDGAAADRLRGTAAMAGDGFAAFAPAERLIASTGADVRHGGGQAYYSGRDDYVRLPDRERFDPPHGYYHTAYHELAHWTAHPARLHRPGGRKGTAAYAREKLVAELAAAYLLAETGVPQSADLGNHRAYVASWLRDLRNDVGWIFKTATAAGKAADYLLKCGERPAAGA